MTRVNWNITELILNLPIENCIVGYPDGTTESVEMIFYRTGGGINPAIVIAHKCEKPGHYSHTYYENEEYGVKFWILTQSN